MVQKLVPVYWQIADIER